MTSATLYREGLDLDGLLAELDEEHPGQVHVVEVTYGREGGVLGFFARKRVGVHYVVDSARVDPASVVALDLPVSRGSTPTVSALEEMLSDADAAEAAEMVASGQVPDAPVFTDDKSPNVEFARMLLDMAAQKAAERLANGEPAVIPFVTAPTAAVVPSTPIPAAAARPVATAVAVPEPAPAIVPAPAPTAITPAPALLVPAPAPPAITPIGSAPKPPAPVTARTPIHAWERESILSIDDLLSPGGRPAGAHRAAPESARTRFSVRRQLSEIGVPVSWIPDDCADAYWVLETLVAGLPTASTPDLRPGDIFVVVGPAVDATSTARQLCSRLRLDPLTIRTAGCPDGQAPLLSHHWQAADLAAQIRSQRNAPVVIVVATDDSRGSDDPDDRWAAGMVKALGADHVWLVLDAGHKPADSRALIKIIGRPEALVLIGAARTTSPASAWELGLPVAVLDGRPASRGAWTALLIDKLSTLDL